MPTKTIYVPDEALQVFDKAKEIAGESLSAVVIQALKDFILKKELEEKCIEPFERWKGTQNYNTRTISGIKVRFYGRKLSDAQRESPDGSIIINYELFYTRKGQYLLYEETLNMNEDTREYCIHTPYKSLSDMIDKNIIPPSLIFDAEKQMPGVSCIEMDV